MSIQGAFESIALIENYPVVNLGFHARAGSGALRRSYFAEVREREKIPSNPYLNEIFNSHTMKY